MKDMCPFLDETDESDQKWPESDQSDQSDEIPVLLKQPLQLYKELLVCDSCGSKKVTSL